VIITLTGANSFGLRRELRGLIKTFLNKYDEMGLERVDGEEAEFNRLSEALTSLPFLVERKLVVLRAPGANKQFVEKAEELLAGVPESTDVVIVEPKLDKRGSYYKLLKKSTDYREFPELDANGMARWLTDAAKAAGGSISQADARYLVERAGASQSLLANELNKLLLHDRTVTKQSIELLTEATPQSTIFELLDAAFAGNARRAMALYTEQRALKVEPQQLIAMLAWQLHVLAVVKTAGGRTPDDIARESKVSAYTVKKSVGIARRLSLTQLRQLVAELLDIDRRLKRESMDADEALQNYLLKLAN
jgi:DNA polymerase III delta subunit